MLEGFKGKLSIAMLWLEKKGLQNLFAAFERKYTVTTTYEFTWNQVRDWVLVGNFEENP